MTVGQLAEDGRVGAAPEVLPNHQYIAPDYLQVDQHRTGHRGQSVLLGNNRSVFCDSDGRIHRLPAVGIDQAKLPAFRGGAAAEEDTAFC